MKKQDKCWFLIGSFAMYMLLLTKLILFKFYNLDVILGFFEDWSLHSVAQNIKNTNLVPIVSTFHSLYDPLSPDRRYYRNIFIYNIIVFCPFGFFAPLVFSKLDSLMKCSVATLLLSFSYEIIQIFSTLGRFDIDDILLNTLGGIIGFCILTLLRYIQNKLSISC